MLNSKVHEISYSREGVTVTLDDGKTLSADYALVSFSLGVLQHDDVKWEPPLPPWKREAIESMTMVRNSSMVTSYPSLIHENRQHIRRSSFSFQRGSGLKMRCGHQLTTLDHIHTESKRRLLSMQILSVEDILSGRIWVMITFLANLAF